MIPIYLHDVSTWPAELIEFLEAHEDVLRKHGEHQRKLFDDSAWGDTYVPMANRTPSPYCSQMMEIRDFLLPERFTTTLALYGYHCTRLTDREVDTIRSAGMVPLGSEHLSQRIRAVEQAGLINSEICTQLNSINDADSPTRKGMLHFIFTRGPLKTRSAVEYLFRNWGGEALYGRHLENPKIGPALHSIGSARIIEAVIPLADLAAFPAEQIINLFLKDRGLEMLDTDWANRTRKPIPASCIKRIISRPEQAFEDLVVGCSVWQPPLT